MTDDQQRPDAPRTETDAVTTGAITGTGTGGLGAAGGTDTTRDVSSVPRDADTPERSSTPLDESINDGGAGDQPIHEA